MTEIRGLEARKYFQCLFFRLSFSKNSFGKAQMLNKLNICKKKHMEKYTVNIGENGTRSLRFNVSGEMA